MLVLAIDTALGACSAAIVDTLGAGVLARLSEPMKRGHAERLPGMVQEIVADAEINLADIDRLGVTIGPGTFTGVRIGLSFARGLALVLDVPVVGISTLQALAAGAFKHRPGEGLWVVQDARREQVYMQQFGADGEPEGSPELARVEVARRRLTSHAGRVCGSGAALVASSHHELVSEPSCPDVVQLARLTAETAPSDDPPSPLYLRPADAKSQEPVIAFQPHPVRLEPIAAEHARILSEIHRQCFAEGWSEDDLSKMVLLPGTVGLIAFDGSNVEPVPVGFVLARAVREEADVIVVAVLQQFQRRGIGTALMTALLHKIGSIGVDICHLEVADDNRAAWSMYERLGFRQNRLRKGYYSRPGSQARDAICASLVLKSYGRES